MSVPYFSPDGPPIGEAELRERLTGYRIQGEPRLRRVARETQGGGFGDAEKHPYAWGLWVFTDGVWRRLSSARGKPREWTSLDRAWRWLSERGVTACHVEAVSETGKAV